MIENSTCLRRLADPLAIGGVTIANRVLLAPMSGVSDRAFRRVAAAHGAGLVVSEMVASEELAGGNPESAMRAEATGNSLHVVQLAGREPHWMAEGARAAADAGAHIIDINMGCPAKRVTTGYSGSALMRDLDHALTLVEATVTASLVPVTLKMRLGWDERSLNAPELARRAEAAGVADKVRFELIDYRRVTGSFDRIVSVGMFEHVGPPQYRTFFRKCRDLLADDGVMLLHSIGRMGAPGVTDDWTVKYIFPGGYNPALSEIVRAYEGLRLFPTDVEVLRLHYSWTLDNWYDRTVAAKDEIVALYDENFYRMWTFYLAGAAAAFRNGGLCNYQVQLCKSRTAVPVTRDYMFDGERALRESAPSA